MHVYNELMFVCVLLLKLFGKIHGPKMKNIFLGEPLPNFFHPQFTKLIAKILIFFCRMRLRMLWGEFWTPSTQVCGRLTTFYVLDYSLTIPWLVKKKETLSSKFWFFSAEWDWGCFGENFEHHQSKNVRKTVQNMFFCSSVLIFAWKYPLMVFKILPKASSISFCRKKSEFWLSV